MRDEAKRFGEAYESAIYLRYSYFQAIAREEQTIKT